MCILSSSETSLHQRKHCKSSSMFPGKTPPPLPGFYCRNCKCTFSPKEGTHSFSGISKDLEKANRDRFILFSMPPYRLCRLQLVHTGSSQSSISSTVEISCGVQQLHGGMPSFNSERLLFNIYMLLPMRL